MIRCEKCGFEGEPDGALCPSCREPLVFREEDLAVMRQALDAAIRKKEFESVLYYRRILAEAGDVESMREWAILLESGEATGGREPDLAEKFFRRAAEKDDPLAAFRYSRLLSRTSERAGRFYLTYSAVLGCKEAYPRVAKLYSADGHEEIANYFLSLAAAAGDNDAAVEMAKRHYEGVGTPASPARAKWYLDRFTIPPIHAIRLAYRLRGVKPEEPPKEELSRYDAILLSLRTEAEACGFRHARVSLLRLLSERGDRPSTVAYAKLLIAGEGLPADPEAGVRLLEEAAKSGFSEAAVSLGDLCLTGDPLPKDGERAVFWYTRAADCGDVSCYRRIADLYAEGGAVERDIARAVELYDKGASFGDKDAAEASRALKEKREKFFAAGKAALATDPDLAFRSFAIAVGMGNFAAELPLGLCYEQGFGTKVDRSLAFFWYGKAVEHGTSAALFSLGLCYAKGIGTRFNYRLALKTLLSASRAGDKRADAAVRELLERRKTAMTRKLYSQAMHLIYLKKFDAAVELLRACEPLGYPKALYTLGCLCEFGRGVPVDKTLAVELYERAYRGGENAAPFRDPKAQYKLQILRMVR